MPVKNLLFCFTSVTFTREEVCGVAGVGVAGVGVAGGGVAGVGVPGAGAGAGAGTGAGWSPVVVSGGFTTFGLRKTWISGSAFNAPATTSLPSRSNRSCRLISRNDPGANRRDAFGSLESSA